MYCSNTTCSFELSLPLLIKRLKTPDAVLTLGIDQRTLSAEPVAKAPPLNSWVPVFITSPSEIVSNTNGASVATKLLASKVIVAVSTVTSANWIVKTTSVVPVPPPKAVSISAFAQVNVSPTLNPSPALVAWILVKLEAPAPPAKTNDQAVAVAVVLVVEEGAIVIVPAL